MITLTSADAQNRFGELVDMAQREPVQVTRRGRPVAYVVSAHDMEIWTQARQRGAAAAQWFASYATQVEAARTGAAGTEAPAALDEAAVNDLVHALR